MKIAIDTNILIRLISNDSPALTKKAANLIKNHSTAEIFISYGVIWETYCVLKSVYTMEKETILNAIEDILNADEFVIENELAIRMALSKSRKGSGFYDALIGEIGSLRNVKTHTFDKGCAKDNNFVVIK